MNVFRQTIEILYFILYVCIMAAKRRNAKRSNTKRRRRNASCARSSFSGVLKKIMKLPTSQRVQAMKIANNKFINDLSNNVKKLRYARVAPKLQKKLSHQSKNLRKFTNSKTSVLTKRRMLTQQRGGFLPLLLAALPALSSILGGVISRV